MLSETIAEILKGDDPWHYATFAGAVQLQLKIDARTSLADKLEWLEQAGRLARRLEHQANVLDHDTNIQGIKEQEKKSGGKFVSYPPRPVAVPNQALQPTGAAISVSQGSTAPEAAPAAER